MRWDRFFEDLEDQLDSEWEAERAALDTEAERLRLARLTLHERLSALATDASVVTVGLPGGSELHGALAGVGPDWLAVESEGSAGRAVVVPLGAVLGLSVAHADLLRSARGGAVSRLRERMTFGFVLRDLVRRRVPVTLQTTGGRELAGTIDRAASDHLDLALHDRGDPRRSDLVSGHRLVPFTAVAAVRLETPVALV